LLGTFADVHIRRIVFIFSMPVALEAIGWKLYMANGAWDVVMFVLIWVFWVETKGRTLEEVDAAIDGKRHVSYAAGAPADELMEKDGEPSPGRM
jgi:hypothetical protein